MSKDFMVGGGEVIVAQFLETFKEYPPRQCAATSTIDQALDAMKRAVSGAGH